MWGPRLVAILLLAGPLALAMPVGAQVQNVAAPPRDWWLEDDTDDVSPLEPGAAPMVPVNPATAHVDILGVEIGGENELGMVLSILVSELRVSEGGGGLFFGEAEYRVAFELANTPFSYEIRAQIWGSTNPDTESIFLANGGWAELCIRTEDQWCYSQPVNLGLDDTANAIRLWIPKASLLGSMHYGGGFIIIGEERGTPDLPASVAAGDQLINLHAESEYGPPFFFPCVMVCPRPSFHDVVPNEGDAPPYALKAGAANTIISVYFDSHGEALPVLAATNQTILFNLVNLASAKRLVTLQYTLEGPAEKVALYKVTGPPSVSIPGGAGRNYTLAVDVKEGAAAGDGVHLVVRGVSVGNPEEVAFATVGLEPALGLGPTSNILFLHGVDAPQFGNPLDVPFCATVFVPCKEGFLSPAAQDPDSDADAIEPFGFPRNPGDHVEFYWIPIKQTLPAPVAFDREKPIEMDLKLRTPVDAQGMGVVAEIRAYGNFEGPTNLFEAATTTSISRDGTVVHLTSPVRLDGLSILPAATDLILFVAVHSSVSPTGTAEFVAGGSEIVTDGSKIVLPLVELPDELKPGAVRSPFQLSVLTGKEDFVNPGEARLFNVSVLNQDVAAHNLELVTTIDSDAWTVEVLPGRRYELASGDAIGVNVLVHAPADAKESDHVRIYLNATDDAGTQSYVLLQATVTTQVDLPDDSGNVKIDADAEDRLIDDAPADTPAPSFLLAVLGLLGLAWSRRARRV